MTRAYLRIKNSLLGMMLSLMLAGLVVPAYAEDSLPNQDSFHQEWERATDEELSALRGGFILPNGMHINMSLEKFIHLNDVLVHATSAQLAEQGAILQVGIRNLIPDSATMPQLSTFIQNTLDSQHIKTLTKINIEIGNLGEMMANSGNHRVFTEFMAPALVR